MKKFLLILSVLLLTTTTASAEYYVKSGDTMWKIAKKHNTNYSYLLTLNPHITNPNLINVGDYIVIPSGDTATDLTDYAKSLQGVTTYVYGGQNPPYQTDCSGWTQYIYGKFGIKLPRVSKDQARVGTPITFKNMKKGDLMFFSTRDDKVISHVGIYLGNNYWISNLSSKQNVTILSTWGKWTQDYFLWAQRVI